MGAAYSKEQQPAFTAASAPSRGTLYRTGFGSLSILNRTKCDAAVVDSLPPPPPPPGTVAVAPPPPPPDADSSGDKSGSDAIAQAAKEVSNITNPGPYEQASSDAKRLVMLDTFDGFRCDINKQVSPFMGVFHSFWVGTSMIPDGTKSTYTFMTQVADEKGLWMVRLDPSRMSVDGRLHRMTPFGMLKVQVNGTPPEGDSDQLLAELDLGAQTWTANLKYGSIAGGPVFGCNFFQAITPNLHMGGEGMYVSVNGNQLSNYTVKYTIPAKTGEEDATIKEATAATGSSTFIGNFNTAQMAGTLNYKRVVTPNRVILGSELQFSPLNLAETKVMLGADFMLSKSQLQICVDGDGRVQSLLDVKLGRAPGSPALKLSADVNHFKEELRFGYGITVEG